MQYIWLINFYLQNQLRLWEAISSLIIQLPRGNKKQESVWTLKKETENKSDRKKTLESWWTDWLSIEYTPRITSVCERPWWSSNPYFEGDSQATLLIRSSIGKDQAISNRWHLLRASRLLPRKSSLGGPAMTGWCLLLLLWDIGILGLMGHILLMAICSQTYR